MTTVSTTRRQGVNSSAAIKVPCALATTANITLSGEQSIDGTTTSSSRVLVKNQTTASENGIYDTNSSSWTRALDFDGAYDVVTGTLVHVIGGATNLGYYYEVTTSGTITIGTTSLTFDRSALIPGIASAANATAITIDASEFVVIGTGATVAAGAKLQTPDGITFPATQVSSSNANTLDDYDEYTAASAACTGAITTAVIWKLVKVGNLVALTLPAITGTATATTYFEYGTVIPAKYRPAANLTFPCLIKDNGSTLAAAGFVYIFSTGAVRVYKDLTAAVNFTNGTDAGFGQSTGTSVSWSI